MKYISKSREETFQIAYEFAKTLKGGDVVCLTGDLGAGKTVFTKGIAEAMGVSAQVVSPTFTIVNEYQGSTLPLYHFDVYRIDDPDELYEIGFDEYVLGNGVSVIEWADKIKEVLPSDVIWVTVSKQSDGLTREIEII